MGQIIDIRSRLTLPAPIPVPTRPTSRGRKPGRRLALAVSLCLHLLAGWSLLAASGAPQLANGLRQGAQGEGPVVTARLVRLPPDAVPNAAMTQRLARLDAPHVLDAGPDHKVQPSSPAASAGPQAPAVPARNAQTQGDTAPAAPLNGVGGLSGSAVDSDFRQRVLEHIERYRQYPQVPGGGAPHGAVQVLVTFARDGSILGVWRQTSSGSVVLDSEALAAVMRSQPLPAIPAGMPNKISMSFILSFDVGYYQ